jgi:hypothetical protein
MKMTELTMKFKYILSILIVLVFSINVFGQTTVNIQKPKYTRASEAYGYIISQEYSLEIIKKEYPQFELNIFKVEASFNSNFGKSKENIITYLKEYLTEIGFKDYEYKMQSEIKRLLDKTKITEVLATNYILEVERRAKGEIISPVLETLLAFQFMDKPHDEFQSGFTTTFNTKGHSKSKNTDWQIKVPKSWRGEEAERPNIIQKFTSDYGSGSQFIMLLVKDLALPKDYKITKSELDEIFSDKGARSMIPEGGKFISFTKMTIDNNIGGMIELEQISERLDYKVKMRMIQFMFIRNNKMYNLQCDTGSEKVGLDMSVEIKKYMPLYRLVANSIVINDQYK